MRVLNVLVVHQILGGSKFFSGGEDGVAFEVTSMFDFLCGSADCR